MSLGMLALLVVAFVPVIWLKTRPHRNGTFAQLWRGRGDLPRLDFVADLELRAKVMDVFRGHGIRDDVMYADTSNAALVTFVVLEKSANGRDLAPLQETLKELLGRPVALSVDGPQWAGKSTWL